MLLSDNPVIEKCSLYDIFRSTSRMHINNYPCLSLMSNKISFIEQLISSMLLYIKLLVIVLIIKYSMNDVMFDIK